MKALFWAGCGFRYRYKQNIEANVKLLEKCGYNVSQLKDEKCCGDAMILSGFEKEALKVASETATMINKVAPDVVITPCAGCYHAFREYANFEIKLPKFQHITQAVAENLSILKFTGPKEKITFHDSCELGRLSGEYDAPRKVLSAVADLVEPKMTRELARCCGAGGMMWSVKAELSVRVSETRIERDIEPTGAKKVITTCPTCQLSLSIAAGRRDNSVEVVDFGTYVLSKLG
jgi:Fe-S oxidoreductase